MARWDTCRRWARTSRFGWSHPGPLYLLLQAPLFWASGARHLSTAVTAAILNLAALVTALVLLARWTRPVLAACAAVLVAVYLWQVPAVVASPWNPVVPVLLLPLLVTLAAGFVAGHRAALPVALFVGSVAVQAHVAFGPVVAATLAGAVAGRLVVTGVRRERWPSSLGSTRVIVAAGLVAAMAWALPLWDAVSPHGTHNLQRLAAFARASVPDNPVRGQHAFEHYVIAPFAKPALEVPHGGTYDSREINRSRAWAAWQFWLLLGAGAVWIWRRQTGAAAWALLLAAALQTAAASLRRLPEPPLDHTVFWVSIVGVLAWAAIAAAPIDLLAGSAVARWTPRVSPRRRHQLAAVGLAGLLVFGVREVLLRAGVDAAPEVSPLAQFVRADVGRPPGAPFLLHVDGQHWGTVAGIAYLLAREGYVPHVDDDWTWMFGARLTPTGTEPVAFTVVKSAGFARDALPAGTRVAGAAGRFTLLVTPTPAAASRRTP